MVDIRNMLKTENMETVSLIKIVERLINRFVQIHADYGIEGRPPFSFDLHAELEVNTQSSKIVENLYYKYGIHGVRHFAVMMLDALSNLENKRCELYKTIDE